MKPAFLSLAITIEEWYSLTIICQQNANVNAIITPNKKIYCR
jgi:hypothetical protein